jgi:hypothetical protein
LCNYPNADKNTGSQKKPADGGKPKEQKPDDKKPVFFVFFSSANAPTNGKKSDGKKPDAPADGKKSDEKKPVDAPTDGAGKNYYILINH